MASKTIADVPQRADASPGQPEAQDQALRRAQVELEASRNRYRDLYDFAPVGYLSISDDGLIQEANLTAASLLGVERRSLWGRCFADLVAGESLPRWEQLRSEVRKGPEQRGLDLELRQGDGTCFTGQLVCQRLSDGEAAPSMRVALADVTAHRKVVADLRLRESLLTAILDGSASGILVVGPTGKVLRANRRFQALWSIPDQLLASGDDRQLLEYVFRQLADPVGFTREVERLYRSRQEALDTVALADGRIFERYSAPFDFDGPGGRLWSFQDVSERTRTGEALRRSEAKFRGLFDTMMDGLVVVDMAGAFRESNQVYRDLLGYSEAELATMTYQQITPEAWHAMEGRIIAEQVMAKGYSDVYEKEYRRKDGSIFPAELRTFLLREDGRPVAMWAIVRDLSGRKAAEAALRASEQRLASAARLAAMGTLVAGMAHEINNPLSVQLGNGALAMEGIGKLLARFRGAAPPDREVEIRLLEEVLDELLEAEAGGQRIQRIVKDLAAIGRPDAKRRRVTLDEVVDAAVRWLPAGVARAVAVQVERGTTPEVLAAPGQLEQVLVNLIANAAGAAAAGTLAQVTIRTGPGPGGTARCEVSDRGAGIDPALRDRIFDPFFTTHEVGQGPGLGLPVALAIVTAHGGTLTVESVVGQGSTFRVELPAAEGKG